jgi:hypothetical protein
LVQGVFEAIVDSAFDEYRVLIGNLIETHEHAGDFKEP